MKTLKNLLSDYIEGLITWIMIVLTLSVFITAANNIFNFDVMNAISYGLTMITLTVFVPLGITYIAKTIKETKTPDNTVGLKYV